VDLFRPVVMVGNQRQSSNSLSVIDLVTRTVTQTLTDSENGSIAFSRDRRFAYVCEPGLQRNRVAVYDLTTSPITARPPIPVSGGIRYQPALAPDGRRMYVPLHDGVSVIDVDATSGTFHTELTKIPVPITGTSGAIFEGPFDCAVTPDGRRLLVCYGERVASYQTPGTLGVIDLTLPSFPHVAIPITNSGALTLLGTPLVSRQRVEVSPDGRYAYAVEFAFKPGMFVQGFTNGGAVNVVDLLQNRETAVLTFGGFGVHELCLDRNGRNLWIAANDVGDVGRVTRIDVDRRSATRNTILTSIPVDPLPFSSGGAFGICATPDGATVCVSIAEDAAHPTPALITIDARTDQVTGAPIVVQSLPATVGVQQS
jgi:DNA-binding beta-propeller fold protein YncE